MRFTATDVFCRNCYDIQLRLADDSRDAVNSGRDVDAQNIYNDAMACHEKMFNLFTAFRKKCPLRADGCRRTGKFNFTKWLIQQQGEDTANDM